VSVESFVTFFALMGAAVRTTANLVDLRYSKISAIWVLNNRVFLAREYHCVSAASVDLNQLDCEANGSLIGTALNRCRYCV
jgi:hypothetical protein